MLREWGIPAESLRNDMCDHIRDVTTPAIDVLLPSLRGWSGINYSATYGNVFQLLKYTTSAQQVQILN